MNQPVLEKLWEQSRNGVAATSAEWAVQVQALYTAGKGLHEALAYLHQTKPALEDFLQWIGSGPQAVQSASDDVLTQADLDFFNNNGYLVFKNAASNESCANARAAISEHLQIDINDPDTWYHLDNKNQGLMVPLYQHPALDEHRYSAKIRKAFEQLYGSTDIYALIEKVSFNPPETAQYRFAGSALHWDASLAQPIPFKLQGLLYLNDCAATAGAFHCVPGFHNSIGEWLRSLPENTAPREYATDHLTAIAVPGNAGDLVIWHQALPHCATANKRTAPRFVQYVTYDPAGYKMQEEWI